MIRNREHTMKSLSALTSQARRKGEYPLLRHAANYKIFVLLCGMVFSSCVLLGRSALLWHRGFCFFLFHIFVVFLFEILVQMYSKKKQKRKANPVSRLKLRNGLLEPICTCMSTARLGWINKNPVVFDNPVDSADLRIRSTAMQKSCFTRIAYR